MTSSEIIQSYASIVFQINTHLVGHQASKTISYLKDSWLKWIFKFAWILYVSWWTEPRKVSLAPCKLECGRTKPTKVNVKRFRRLRSIGGKGNTKSNSAISDSNKNSDNIIRNSYSIDSADRRIVNWIRCVYMRIKKSVQCTSYTLTHGQMFGPNNKSIRLTNFYKTNIAIKSN